jgi:hypothetical protein
MGFSCRCIPDACMRLAFQDQTLVEIDLSRHKDRPALHYHDYHLVELLDRLIQNPNIIRVLNLDNNLLTDVTGVKLAKFIALSKTIRRLSIRNNYLGPRSCIALSLALHTSSLRTLQIGYNSIIDEWARAFTLYTMRTNVYTNERCTFSFYKDYDNRHLKFTQTVKRFTAPSMLDLLIYTHFDSEEIEAKKH